MIKLYGVAISNYYNVAKLGLLEKGIEFEEVHAPPSQEPDFLERSPMGKIPFIEVDSTFISESHAILAFLDKLQPEPSHFPDDPIEAGKAMQLHQIVDLYIDGPARTLLGAAFFGRSATEAQIQEVSEKLAKGVAAFKRIAVFGPFVAGETLTHADFPTFLTLPLARDIMTKLGAPDPVAGYGAFEAYARMMAKRPHFKGVVEARAAAAAKLLGANS